jgi:hypothetical protein
MIMKRQGGILVLLLVLLAGCSGVKDENSTISIKPHSLSEDEEVLISKTGVDAIQFFRINGTLKEEEDLQFAVEIYKDGRLTEDQVYTMGQVEKEFKQGLISYGFDRQGDQLIFLNGIINGLLEQKYDLDGTDSSSFTSLINEKKTLIKDEAVYLTAWIGSKGNMLAVPSLNGDGSLLSQELYDTDAAYVFKVTLTDVNEE